MKVSVKTILAWIYSIPQGIGAYRKYVRVTTDIEEALAEWDRIGGFKASTGALLNYVSKYAVNLVEYATWTPIEWDDHVTKIIRDVLIDHRDAVMCLIEWIRREHEPSLLEFTAMAEAIHVSSNDEYGSPMTVLYIIGMLYHMLIWLKAKQEAVPDDGETAVEPVPVPVRRPVLNFVRKLFNKQFA